MNGLNSLIDKLLYSKSSVPQNKNLMQMSPKVRPCTSVNHAFSAIFKVHTGDPVGFC